MVSNKQIFTDGLDFSIIWRYFTSELVFPAKYVRHLLNAYSKIKL